MPRRYQTRAAKAGQKEKEKTPPRPKDSPVKSDKYIAAQRKLQALKESVTTIHTSYQRERTAAGSFFSTGPNWQRAHAIRFLQSVNAALMAPTEDSVSQIQQRYHVLQAACWLVYDHIRFTYGEEGDPTKSILFNELGKFPAVTELDDEPKQQKPYVEELKDFVSKNEDKIDYGERAADYKASVERKIERVLAPPKAAEKIAAEPA